MRSGGMDGRGKKKGKFPRLKYRRRQADVKETAGKEMAKGEWEGGREEGGEGLIGIRSQIRCIEVYITNVFSALL